VRGPQSSGGGGHLAHEVAAEPLDELLELGMIGGLEPFEEVA
jgi:hypothetical protein